MAGKVAALMLRPFVKARDWYDWLWYRSKPEGECIEPNLEYLQAAIDQFAQKNGRLSWDANDWLDKLRERLTARSFPESLVKDMGRFLEHPEDACVMTRDNFIAALDADNGLSM
jgi:hypothetical protein